MTSEETTNAMIVTNDMDSRAAAEPEQALNDSVPIQTQGTAGFDLKKYLDKIAPKVKEIKERPCKKFEHHPTVFENGDPEHVQSLVTAFKVRQLQMKEGEIGQIVLGNLPGWEDLKTGHSSGLDCRKLDNSQIMEVKNKYNTVKGSDIKKSLLPTLAKYKNANPRTECIWAIINPKPDQKNLSETIVFDDVEILKLQGKELFSYVMTYDGIDYSKDIIKAVKEMLA